MTEYREISLFNSLNKETLKAGVTVSTWEEAVKNVGNLMVTAGLVENTYIQAMVDTVKTIGPYIVIAPGIAMPHARPEAGVHRSGFCLVTLTKPVEFGNEDNDPVDILIGFSALNKEEHITALREIATHFSDEQFVNSIRNAQTTQALVDLFQPKRKKS